MSAKTDQDVSPPRKKKQKTGPQDRMEVHVREVRERFSTLLQKCRQQGECVEITEEVDDDVTMVWLFLPYGNDDADDDDAYTRAVHAEIEEHQGKTRVTFSPQIFEEKITPSMLRGWVERGYRIVKLHDKSPLPYDDTVIRDVQSRGTLQHPIKCVLDLHIKRLNLDRKIVFDQIKEHIQTHLGRHPGDADLRLVDCLPHDKKTLAP